MTVLHLIISCVSFVSYFLFVPHLLYTQLVKSTRNLKFFTFHSCRSLKEEITYFFALSLVTHCQSGWSNLIFQFIFVFLEEKKIILRNFRLGWSASRRALFWNISERERERFRFADSLLFCSFYVALSMKKRFWPFLFLRHQSRSRPRRQTKKTAGELYEF